MPLQAPGHWRCLDFLSDLHLQAADPENFTAWSAYMRTTPADALFLLGDIFEVWVGDDILSRTDSFEVKCANLLRETAARIPVYLMPGNRDFLMGSDLMRYCGTTLLADPSVLLFGGQRWLLSHGDSLCLQDTEYQEFRNEVRSERWQIGFLSRPLGERLTLARQMREQSEQRKHRMAAAQDVDHAAAQSLLLHWQAHALIHGHTHLPATHTMAGGALRHVLSDWDMRAKPERAEILRLSIDPQQAPGVATRRLSATLG
jgi:UDP-2,3-diacylglucosamine hydrolase